LMVIYFCFWQLPIETPRKIASDFLDRFLDNVVIINQPFGSRRYGCATVNVSRNRTVDLEYFFVIGLVSREKLKLEDLRQFLDAIPAESLADIVKLFICKIGCPDRIVVIHLIDIKFASCGGRSTVKRHVFSF